MTHNKKLINKFSKTLIITICLLSISTVKSQTSLTKALDYDGDGKADSIVYRLSENNWYINKSSGGYGVQQFGVFPFDTPTPGDYDGDGKGDIAVVRDLYAGQGDQLEWWIINSSNDSVVQINYPAAS